MVILNGSSLTLLTLFIGTYTLLKVYMTFMDIIISDYEHIIYIKIVYFLYNCSF